MKKLHILSKLLKICQYESVSTKLIFPIEWSLLACFSLVTVLTPIERSLLACFSLVAAFNLLFSLAPAFNFSARFLSWKKILYNQIWGRIQCRWLNPISGFKKGWLILTSSTSRQKKFVSLRIGHPRRKQSADLRTMLYKENLIYNGFTDKWNMNREYDTRSIHLGHRSFYTENVLTSLHCSL